MKKQAQTTSQVRPVDRAPTRTAVKPKQELPLGPPRSLLSLPVHAPDRPVDPGRTLSPELRQRFNALSSRPIDHVRIHDGDAAARAAAALRARAFTVGRDIYFARGAYAPESRGGQHVLAHEVAHAQQPAAATHQGVMSPNSGAEVEAERFASAFDTAAVAPVRPMTLQATRSGIALYPDVLPSALAADRGRLIDPLDPTSGKVYVEGRGYLKNPTATELSKIVVNGKVGGGFENGEFMYVVDERGVMWVGKRLGKNMPHPTLLGGENPAVTAAGMLEVRGGKITRIDNHSGHYQPPRGALRGALRTLLKLPKAVFKNLRAESIKVDPAGVETRLPFRSLRLVNLGKLNPVRALRRLRLRWKNDAEFRGRVKGWGKAGLLLIAMLVADYYFGKWAAQAENDRIRKALEKLAPQVETAMQNSLERNIDRFDELNAVNPDTKIYLNMEYRLIFIEATSGPGTEENGPIEGFYDATFVSAELSESPVADGVSYHHSDYCLGSTTKYRTLTMSQELRVGDLYADETESLDTASTKGTAP